MMSIILRNKASVKMKTKNSKAEQNKNIFSKDNVSNKIPYKGRLKEYCNYDFKREIKTKMATEPSYFFFF